MVWPSFEARKPRHNLEACKGVSVLVTPFYGVVFRHPMRETTKKPLPTVGGFILRHLARDANPVPVAFTGQEKYTRFQGAVKVLVLREIITAVPLRTSE